MDDKLTRVLLAGVVLATVGTHLPTGGEKRAEAKRAAATSTTKKDRGSGLAAVHDFLAAKIGEPPALVTEPGCVCARNYTFQHLVVTIPDPEHSAYSHLFDQSVESIERSFEALDYSFDRFWFPWKATDDEGTPLDEQEPGLMLFRHQQQKDLLAVFLVGENPKSGINKLAFSRAVQLIAHLGGWGAKADCHTPHVLRIAGPSFSGSAWSLRQSLQALEDIAEVHMITGSATNPDIEYILRSGSPDRAAGPNLPFLFSYGATVENDRRSAKLFFDYTQKGLSGKRLAVLAESDTAFGEGIAEAVQHGENEALVLRFPTEISRIRSAYQDDPALNALSPGSKGDAGTQEGVPLKLKDSHEGAGNVPLFSPDQTTPSQDMVLQNILSTLAREKIDLTGIAATHVVDAIFLSTMIERHCRNVRPFIFDSDVLFLDATPEVSLRGMLQISNYPLLARNQMWTQEGGAIKHVREFPSRYAQGVYNAIQLLFDGGDAIEYSRPGEPSSRTPALWLTTEGADEFWPVALLDAANGGSDAVSSLTKKLSRVPAKNTGGIPVEFEPPAKLWTLALTFVCLWALLHAGAFAYHNIFAGTSNWMSIFWFDPEETSNNRAKRLSLALATVCLLLIVIMLAIAQCWYTAHRNDAAIAYLAMPLPLLAAAVLVATLVALVRRRPVSKAVFLGVAAWSALVLGLTLGLFDFRNLGAGGNLYGTFFVYRSLHPGNGVSPLVPVLLLFIGLYAWAMGGLRRLRVYEDRRAFLPELLTDKTFRGNQTLMRRRLDAAIARLWFDGRTLGTASVVIGISVVFTLRWVRIESLEGPWFDVPFEILLILLQAAMVLMAARLLYAWSALRSLLHLLECHPIRNAFSRLEGHYSWLSLWKRGSSRQKFTTTIGSVERLRVLLREPLPAMKEPTALAQEDYRETLRPLIQDLEALTARMLDDDSAGLRLSPKLQTDQQLVLGKLSRSLEDTLLGPYWNSQSPVPVSPTERLDADKTGEHYAVFIAEEFVALRFVAHIRYVLQQLRNMVEFLATGFILLAFALIIYPFDPAAAISTAIFVDFVALGGVVVLVFSQMDRNALLSRLAKTDPGKLDLNFVFRVASFGALPVATLLASQFPSVGHFLSTWLRPALESLK